MTIIVSEITNLKQYLSVLKETLESFRPERCIHCGMLKPRCHGHYDRKADRENTDGNSLNPVPILRFYCAHCKHTCSVLPECIPPHRWYLWSVQHIVFIYLIAGKSLNAVETQVQPSRSTCRRWWNRAKDQFLLHRDALCTKITELGRAIDFNDFWKSWFTTMSLDQAMLVCHLAGVAIP
jgi:Domain of unknown function (DUF6431)